jgi:hypothetical protein
MLERLHTATVAALLDRINSGEATASDLNVARQLLKDHGITALPEKHTGLQELLSKVDLDDPDTVAARFV